MLVADALGAARLVAAAALPGTITHAAAAGDGRHAPLVLFALAAATDFVDGIVARRATGGPTRHGAVLDNVADVAFVLAGTGTAAVLGLVSPAVPAAIVLSVGAYAVASARRSAAAASVSLARSRLGHAAGVVNYAVTGVIALALAFPGRFAAPLQLASIAAVATNLAAVLARVVRRAPR
jgi:phosphatidylglycerophosphate synthase